MRELDARAAWELLKSEPGAVYVDVRTPGEYDQGHPEGAWNMPIALAGMMGMRGNPDFAAVAQRVLPKDVTIVVGCKSGPRSAMACQVLEQAGFPQCVNVLGGFLGGSVPGWAQLGLPSTTQPTPGKTWAELSSGG
jgi:rhodanese-related sulfurtransferase